jgi:23S rRNA pseudouridine1911/1915/1917 synthase
MFMLSILYEDAYLIAVNKPAGLRAEGKQRMYLSMEAEVAAYLKVQYPWKKQLIAGVVHRLDRLVSGVMLFAKTPMALKELGRQFENRTVRKYYWAIVDKKLPSHAGELTHWLIKDTAHHRALVFNEEMPDAQKCSLRYRKIKGKEGYCLLEIELLTGRYHQIRAQLEAMGCPIVGDVKYGSQIQPEGEGVGIHLHAVRLAILHPNTGEPLELIAPLPTDGAWPAFI